jgi:AcrR family transcriptional regulator
MAKGKNRLSAEERRHQILLKASEIFAEHGLDGTRTRDLAKACGINESLLYKHFSSKENLYKEAMAHLHDQMVEMWRGGPPLAALSSAEIIKTAIENSCSYFSQNPQIAANMLHGVAVTPRAPDMASQAMEWFSGYHKYVRSLLERGVADGSVKPDIDVEAAAISLIGILWVCAISHVIQDEEISKHMNPRRIVDSILGTSDKAV